MATLTPAQVAAMTMTDREKRRLKTLEDGIRNSGKMMYEGMRAIHDEKLYRDEFETWEAYCSERWGMSKQYAYRLIEHGKVLGLMNEDVELKTVPIGTVSESATRELKGLPDAKKVEVIKAVAAKTKPSKNGKPRVTATAVREAVAETNGHAKPKPKGREVTPAKMVDDLVRNYVSPLVRGVDAVAEINGGKGGYHTQASASLDSLIASLREMREGKQ